MCIFAGLILGKTYERQDDKEKEKTGHNSDSGVIYSDTVVAVSTFIRLAWRPMCHGALFICPHGSRHLQWIIE